MMPIELAADIIRGPIRTYNRAIVKLDAMTPRATKNVVNPATRADWPKAI